MMADDKKIKSPDRDAADRSNVVSLTSTLDRTLAAAKKGERDPRLLSEDDIQLVCRALLIQYAQMGIS